MLFNYQYSLFHIIARQLDTLLSTMNNFSEAVTEEVDTLFPQPQSHSSLNIFIRSIMVSPQIFFHFWEEMEITRCQICALWWMSYGGEIQSLKFCYGGTWSLWSCTVMMQENISPYTVCILRWISLGVTPSAVKNSMTARCFNRNDRATAQGSVIYTVMTKPFSASTSLQLE